jgi:hypothetical protein
LIKWNFGITKVQEPNFAKLFAHYIPEILIVASILIHIVIETHAGIFNVSAYATESFKDGFERYLKHKVPQYFEEMMQEKLNKAIMAKLDKAQSNHEIEKILKKHDG